MADAFVPYKNREQFLLHGVPGPHQRRLTRKATQQRTSVANVVCSLLAVRYGLPFEPSRRPGRNGAQPSLSLRIPPAVMDAVRQEANDRAVTIRTVMLDALSDGLGLKKPEPTSVDPAKRPGRPRTERID